MYRRIVFAAFLALFVAGPANGQQNATQAGDDVLSLEATGRGVVSPIEDPQLKMMLFDALDEAGEGVITKQEFQQGTQITIDTDQFDVLDANNDGVIDRQEFMNVRILIEGQGAQEQEGRTGAETPTGGTQGTGVNTTGTGGNATATQ
jgi:hypothetical protein